MAEFEVRNVRGDVVAITQMRAHAIKLARRHSRRTDGALHKVYNENGVLIYEVFRGEEADEDALGTRAAIELERYMKERRA